MSFTLTENLVTPEFMSALDQARKALKNEFKWKPSNLNKAMAYVIHIGAVEVNDDGSGKVVTNKEEDIYQTVQQDMSCDCLEPDQEWCQHSIAVKLLDHVKLALGMSYQEDEQTANTVDSTQVWKNREPAFVHSVEWYDEPYRIKHLTILRADSWDEISDKVSIITRLVKDIKDNVQTNQSEEIEQENREVDVLVQQPQQPQQTEQVPQSQEPTPPPIKSQHTEGTIPIPTENSPESWPCPIHPGEYLHLINGPYGYFYSHRSGPGPKNYCKGYVPHQQT